MRKKYINPEIQVVKMQTSTLICTTSPLYNVQVDTTVEMEEEEDFE